MCASVNEWRQIFKMVLTTYIPCLIPFHNTIPWPAVLMTAAVLADEPGIQILLFCCKYTGYMSLNLKLQFILRLIRSTESFQLFVFALESNQKTDAVLMYLPKL